MQLRSCWVPTLINRRGAKIMGNVLEGELRKAQRVAHLGRVFAVSDSRFGTRRVAYLQDISTTGCRVISESLLKVGIEFELSLVASWAERDIVVEMAKVQWVDGTCYGLEFLAMDPLERERLRQFLKTLPPVSDVGVHERGVHVPASPSKELRANQNAATQLSPCDEQDKKSLIHSILSIF